MRRTWLDPALPPAERARALLAQMTTAEKVAQLVGVWVNEHAEDQAPFRTGRFLARLRERHPHGFGSLTRPYGSGPTSPAVAATQVDAVQRYLVEETRLGIPALVHEECLTGLMAPGATVLPSPLAGARPSARRTWRRPPPRWGSRWRVWASTSGSLRCSTWPATTGTAASRSAWARTRCWSRGSVRPTSPGSSPPGSARAGSTSSGTPPRRRATTAAPSTPAGGS